MHKFNKKQKNLNSTWNSLVSYFSLYAIKLYLGKKELERTEENNQQYS